MLAVAGIDVSKAILDVAIAEGPVHRFENSDLGIRRLRQHMDRAGATQAVCEATGGYERLLVSRLRDAGITVQGPIRYGCAPSHAPVATRRRRTPWMPGCSRAMAKCSRPRTPVRPRARRNARSCNNCCAGAGNWLTSGSRNGTGWTRASDRPLVGPLGGTSPGSTRRSRGWTRSIRPCCSAVRPSAHKPRCTAAYRGWAP